MDADYVVFIIRLKQQHPRVAIKIHPGGPPTSSHEASCHLADHSLQDLHLYSPFVRNSTEKCNALRIAVPHWWWVSLGNGCHFVIKQPRFLLKQTFIVLQWKTSFECGSLGRLAPKLL